MCYPIGASVQSLLNPTATDLRLALLRAEDAAAKGEAARLAAAGMEVEISGLRAQAEAEHEVKLLGFETIRRALGISGEHNWQELAEEVINKVETLTRERDAVAASFARYSKAMPADWLEDSSLETWFPLTAEEIVRITTERDSALAEVARLTIQLKSATYHP